MDGPQDQEKQGRGHHKIGPPRPEGRHEEEDRDGQEGGRQDLAEVRHVLVEELARFGSLIDILVGRGFGGRAGRTGRGFRVLRRTRHGKGERIKMKGEIEKK